MADGDVAPGPVATAQARGPMRLSVADQALMNLMGYLSIEIFVASPNYRMAVECLHKLMPRIGRELPIVARMADAATALLAAEPGTAEHTSARHRGSVILTEFLFWRAGLALDAIPGWVDQSGSAEGAA